MNHLQGFFLFSMTLKNQKMYLYLETERLRIRPIKLTDAPFMLKLVNSEGWIKFIGKRNISNLKAAQKYIQKILNHENFYYNVFELKGTQQAIGIVTFLKRETEKFPDIGFALLPEFEKKGYTFEASQKYLEEIIARNVYDNIIAVTIPENYKSIRLLKKLGLEYEGDYTNEGKTLSYYGLQGKEDE